MNNNFVKIIIFLVALLISGGCGHKVQQQNILLLPNLPYPIAMEPALVTTAGQGPEGIIVAKICDRLKINNRFQYKAENMDLENINSLIIVEGVSNEGLKAAFSDLNNDITRIENLLAAAKKRNITTVLVIPGGITRRSKTDDKVVEKIFPKVAYVIALHGADKDGFYSNLAEKYNVRLTLVGSLRDMPVPLNSVFR